MDISRSDASKLVKFGCIFLMSDGRNVELIRDLVERAQTLPHRDDSSLDALRRRSEMIIRKLFGPVHKYLADLGDISFHPHVYPTNEINRNVRWNDGKTEIINLFNTIIEELTLFGGDGSMPEQTNDVFIVHGHDEQMKLDVARTLNQLGLDEIILHERPDRGRTIIEKFIDYSNVFFAVVLLTPDDKGGTRDDDPEDYQYRARQNVILELGFFIGKLGRGRVFVLHRVSEDFEFPSDYSGVLYTPYDNAGAWKQRLVMELQASNYDVDANDLSRG